MTVERVRVRRVAEGEDAGAWKRALEDASVVAGGQVLKDEPGSGWVRWVHVSGRDIVVKCRLLNTAGRRAKAAVGLGHGDKQWRGAERLRRAEIACGRPLLLARAWCEGRPVELLVLEHVRGRSLLDVLDDVRAGSGPPVGVQHAIARATGRMVAALVRAGVWNRDNKPSNLIVTGEGERVEVVLIDLVGIKPIALRGMDDDLIVAEMLASLLIEPTGCGCRPRSGLRMAVLRAALDALGWSGEDRARRRAAARSLIDEVESILLSHGDPRPKVNPRQGRSR